MVLLMGCATAWKDSGSVRSKGREAMNRAATSARRSFWLRVLVVSISVCLSLAACGNVQVKPNEPIGTSSLKPTQEDKQAGLVGIASGFTLRIYRAITVETFPITGKGVSGEDKEFALLMPMYFQAKLMTELRAAALFEDVKAAQDGTPQPEPGKTLKLQGQITEVSGGSRGLRFWIGFGAGRSRVQVETRLVDAYSGAMLLVTADRRIGVMSEAMSLDYGGSSQDLLEQTFTDMARDYVRFLQRLALGQGHPQK